MVISAQVVGGGQLSSALTAAVDGDVISLLAGADNSYNNLGELTLAANNVTLVATSGLTASASSQAVINQKSTTSGFAITGQVCLVVSGDNVVIDGLTFDQLDILQDSTCGGGTGGTGADSSILITGDNNVIRNSSFLGEVNVRTGIGAGDPYHWIALRGNNNHILRNRFSGKNTDLEGSAITIFANPSTSTDRSHIIEYNLFKDFVGISGSSSSRDSGAHAIQVGRTTGADSAGDGLHIVRFNRFENIQTERRIMRVQSSSNQVIANTFINTLGNIGFEDGFGNIANRNIILSAGTDSDDSGISFTPLGHTITNNYVSDLRTTSDDRAGLLINNDPLSGSGNTAILANTALDFYCDY